MENSNKIALFMKVSYEEFAKNFEKLAANRDDLSDAVKEVYSNIKIPRRATKGSAGYDFFSPIDFTLEPGESIKIPTGIRVSIKEGWWLGILPRSGMGFKYRFQLDNTMGVIDEDYFFADNEGHIFIKVTNDSREGKTITVKQQDAFAQGIFLPYGITCDDDVTCERHGGLGSTSK